MRGRYDRHASRAERWARQRRALNEAVAQAVALRGSAATLRDICSSAGVGRNTFYLHFRDLETAKRIAIDQAGAALESALRWAPTSEEIAMIAMTYATDNAIRRALLLSQGRRKEEPFLSILERAFAARGQRAERATALAGGAVAILRRHDDVPPPSAIAALFG
ncbi:MAG: TetR family transcriptional regulator [Polyangiaceae bacterium]